MTSEVEVKDPEGRQTLGFQFLCAGLYATLRLTEGGLLDPVRRHHPCKGGDVRVWVWSAFGPRLYAPWVGWVIQFLMIKITERIQRIISVISISAKFLYGESTAILAK